MSVWLAEGLIRQVQHLSAHRVFLRHIPMMSLLTSSHSPGQQFVHTWLPRQRETCMSGSLVRPLKFFRSVHHEEKELLPNASLPADDVRGNEPKRRSFYDELQRCSSPSDVLDLTCRYAPTAGETSNCLTHMLNTTKEMSEKQRRLERRLMFEHVAFPKLLSTATKRAARMRDEDVVYSLLALVNLRVPQRSLVVQIFLRACQERLNNFDEMCLSILAAGIHQMEETANVTALKEGMRLLMEERLPTIKNLITIQNMMRALGRDLTLDLRRKIEGKALSMTEQFNLSNSRYMISVLADVGFVSEPLLEICCKKIQEDLSEIPVKKLVSILHTFKMLNYRNSDFLTNISDYAASMMDIWSKKQLIILLSVLESFTFCPSELIKAFAGKVIAEPGALVLKDILCILRVYSSVNLDLEQQKHPFLESISQALDYYVDKMSGFELLKAVYHLCLMGHFPAALLQQLLQSSTLLQEFETTAPTLLPNQEKMFRVVDLCLRLECPALPEPLEVPQLLLGYPDTSPSPPRPWLSESLQSVLEERPDTVLEEAVVVENFHLIDAVITKPQASCTEEASDSPAASSHRLALLFSPNCFCLDTSRLRGYLAFKVRYLKKLGYDDVMVFDQRLQSMVGEERVHLLRSRLFPEDHKQPDS